jgi:hypothetical protein
MSRWNGYDLLVGFGLFLMGPFDFVSTFLLIDQKGIGLEVNPIMREAFSYGVGVAGVVKIIQLLLLFALFYWFKKLVVDSKGSDEEYSVTLCFKVTVGVFFGWSFFVAVNNSANLLLRGIPLV